MRDIGQASIRSEPGTPAPADQIPLCVPEIRGNEWQYVKECLDTNWVSSAGSFVDQFESKVAEYIGAKYAVSAVNGTSALHIALLVAGVQPDDEVLVSSLSFIAPANAVRYVGAWPVFMDSDPDYWQMDPQKVTSFLEHECNWKAGALINKATGRRVTAVLPVHILGHPCDMSPILEAADKYNLVTIEDATESLGAKYQGTAVGNLGDISCLSFNGNKLITTGGGGMIVTNNQKWAERALYLTTQAKDDPIEYVHNEIGYNYRLTNIQAAIGLAQMELIDEFISQKRNIASIYQDAFQSLPGITTMPTQTGTDPVFWLYTVLLSEQTTLEQRKNLISQLNQTGIGARPLWHPLHNLPPYLGCHAFQIENAIRTYERGVSLPSSVGLEPHQQEQVIHAIKQNAPK